jgi:hypothetical protein
MHVLHMNTSQDHSDQGTRGPIDPAIVRADDLHAQTGLVYKYLSLRLSYFNAF